MTQLIFLTLFLGLTSGVQHVSLQADPAVKSIRLELNGRSVATIEHAPWTAKVDFGPDLVAQKFVAIGYDSAGHELARAEQILNLPRADAEVEIVIRSGDAGSLVAQLVGKHRAYSPPRRSKVWVDGKAVAVDREQRARLPRLDWSRPHLVAAEMRFEDGVVARREGIVQGGFTDFVTTELTPVLISPGVSASSAPLDGCFYSGHEAVRATTIEKAAALVIVVKDPDSDEIRQQLSPFLVRPADRETRLAADTLMRIQWTVPDRFSAPGEPGSNLFPAAGDFTVADGGMLWLLMQQWARGDPGPTPRLLNEAVAVAGVNAVASGRRRAVVAVLSGNPSASRYTSASVRRYLRQIGVPLFVWSVETPTAEVTSRWGDVEEISSVAKLREAVAKLKETLEAQRIAWLATDPLTALSVKAQERCGLKVVTQH